ncbi:hypothetical protein [Paenibacillus sp. NPDC057934]|uniref:hypothetical protein n=1 Tax=Paenibacillus sp. NPDC057934 TaxID=3346282 RepID=UPI0036D9A839
MSEHITQVPLQSGFGATTTAQEVIGNVDLKGKVVIVTGGYSGIDLRRPVFWRMLAPACLFRCET